MSRPIAPFAVFVERFWARVDTSPGHGPWGDCHVWTGGCNSKGYGAAQRGPGERTGLAHRVAWTLRHGKPPPDTPHVLHRCDNPPCCRDDHLFLGTPLDNTLDKCAKGRHGRAGGEKGEAHHAAKLREGQVREIRRLCAGGRLQRAVAVEFGVSQGTVSAIVRHVHWGHVS